MKGSIKTQILGQTYLTIMEAFLIFAAIESKETPWIVISIIFGVIYILFLLQCIKIIKELKGKKTKDKFPYVYLIVLIIIGSFCFVCTKKLIEENDIKKNGESVIARVHSINETTHTETTYDEDGNSYDEEVRECTLEIKYSYNGKSYLNEYDVKTCNHEVGDKLDIIVDKDDPTQFVSKSGNIILIVGCILCYSVGIFVVFNGINFKKTKSKKSKK